jgi:hypothetical protein
MHGKRLPVRELGEFGHLGNDCYLFWNFGLMNLSLAFSF